MMVRDFQSVIGRECLTQMPELTGRQPDVVIACVGGGSNAMGIFYPYHPPSCVKLIGVEAAGEGIATGRHAASLGAGRPGVLHGNRTYLLQNADGQIAETHSVSAGLDYPGVGPEHAWLKDSGRADYVASPTTRRSPRSTTAAASRASSRRSNRATRSPTRRSSHRRCPIRALLLVNLSGRGDKDMNTVAERAGLKFYCRPECDPYATPLNACRPLALNRIDVHLRHAARGRAHGARPVRHRGRSVARRDGAAAARAGRRRRRRDRARRAVFRSDGRRPGDPARVGARAGARRRLERRAGHGRGIPEAGRGDADGADGLCQSDRGDGHRARSRIARETPASTA